MRISAKAEYACVAMLELAANYREPQPVRIKAIAEAQGIPPRFLVQILLQLKGAGLVASSRGAAGGYHLTRTPDTIRLAEIISVIDPTSLGPSGPRVPSASSVVRVARGVWHEVQQQEQRILEKTTLAHLVQRSRESDVLSYQI